MRARVQLKEGVSYQVRDPCGPKTWKRNTPEVLTDKRQIEFYKTNGRFTVTMLQDAPKAKAKAKPVASTSDESGGGSSSSRSSGSGRSSRRSRSSDDD